MFGFWFYSVNLRYPIFCVKLAFLVLHDQNFLRAGTQILVLVSRFYHAPSGTVSIVTLAVLSLQRLLMIVDANKFNIRSYGTAYMIIGSIWCYTCCITLPPFFGFGEYVPETSGLT